jgi:Putative Ig domain
MTWKLAIFGTALLLGALGHANAADAPPNRFYPDNAVLVPFTDRANLQLRLTEHDSIRLEPGNYTTSNPLTKIILRSGKRIYGLGNNVPEIEVEPGTSGAVVSGVHCTLTFPATTSSAITEQNLFRHVTYSTIKVLGGRVEENVFLNSGFSKWVVDHTAGGSWGNNRIIRFQNHTATPMITMKGTNTSRAASSGNVFLWMNSLGAFSEICNIADQKDLTIVFADFESYSSSGGNGFTVRNVDDLSIFGTFGSMRTGRTLDQGATSMWLHGHQLGSYVAPAVVQQSSNTASVMTLFSQDMAAPQNLGGGNRLRMFTDSNSASKTLLLNEGPLTAPLSGGADTALMHAVSTSRSAVAWERPTFNPIPNPAGPGWNADLASKPSSRASIQSEIDSKGTVFLAAGAYYLDGPLVLGKGRGLIGAGMDQTVLIAKNSSIDLLVGDTQTGATSMILADVTLQGGRSGIHHTTNRAQHTDMTISHVTFRDMADSGIWLEGIYAWDNNFIDFVNFTNCPAGIKQRARLSGTVSDTDPDLTYLDKNVFYQCQFVGCGKALDLIGNRPSNGNTWINCLFQNNTNYVSAMRSHNSAIFANCDFINNNGHPVVNVQGQLYLVSCSFSDSTSGATDFVDGWAINLEGCTFTSSGSSAVVVSAANPTWVDLTNPANNTSYRNHNSFFFNCNTTNVPLNLMFAGIAVNSLFPDRADLSVKAVLVRNEGTTITPLVTGSVLLGDVKPQLLVGTTMPSGLTSEVPDNAPTITSSNTASATINSPFAYLIRASNSPSSYAATGLPSWLSYNASTGLVGGTPPTGTLSTTFSVTATNFIGTSIPLPVALTVSLPLLGAPVITSAPASSGQLGISFSYQIVASNSPTSFAAIPLPPGLSLNTTTGAITGTPTALGNTVSTLSATNTTGTGSASLIIDIQPVPIVVPSGSGSSSSGGGSGGSGGCGLGATSALAMLVGLWLIAVRRWRP